MLPETLLTAWPIGDTLACTPVPSGSVNDVYRVETANATWFLRAYRTANAATVAREHHLIGVMRRAGIPAMAPLPTSAGPTALEIEGRMYALYPQAPGEQVERAALTPTNAAAAGTMLAQLHAAARPLPDVGYRTYDFAWGAERWIARLERIAQAIHGQPTLDPTDTWALERVQAQARWMADPACAHVLVPQWPAQVTHGDYHDANLFFMGQQVSAIIDWEQALFIQPAYEVARAAAYMFALEPAPSRAFLAAYRETSGMSPAELAEGAACWGIMSDHHVWALEEVYLNNNQRARRFIPHRPFEPFAQAWARVV